MGYKLLLCDRLMALGIGIVGYGKPLSLCYGEYMVALKVNYGVAFVCQNYLVSRIVLEDKQNSFSPS